MNYEDFQVGISDGVDNSSTARTVAAAMGAMPTGPELLAAILLAGSFVQWPAGMDPAPILTRALEWAELLIALSEGSARKGGPK